MSVPSLGNRIWAKFRRASFKLSAVAINHGEIPAIAWKVELAGQSIVFAGAFNNDKDVIRNFAKKRRRADRRALDTRSVSRPLERALCTAFRAGQSG